MGAPLFSFLIWLCALPRVAAKGGGAAPVNTFPDPLKFDPSRPVGFPVYLVINSNLNEITLPLQLVQLQMSDAWWCRPVDPCGGADRMLSLEEALFVCLSHLLPVCWENAVIDQGESNW